MVQFRRLDPLANAGPWQRATKRGVKSFALTEEQYDRVAQQRPGLIVTEEENLLLGRPYRDFLEVHYAYPEVPAFRERFKSMLKGALAASSRDEAPRGVLLGFRDRPNRPMANQLFWEAALVESRHWVEVAYNAVPEMDEPSDDLDGGFKMREATEADRNAIADIEAAATGQSRLTDAGIDTIYANARWLWLAEDGSGKPVAVLVMRREPAGWGVIDDVFVQPDAQDSLREPLAKWALAFLRNNGGRRQRRRIYLEDDADLQMMRGLGYAPGESGVDYVRPVEDTDIQVQVEERQSHGTIIKFGNWR